MEPPDNAPKEFCENPTCENPGTHVVSVSTQKPGDQKRTLCTACEEAYSWGVQHGTMAAQVAYPQLSQLLAAGFVLLTWNRSDPSKQGPFEAWAYRGPLDLLVAEPIRFGAGPSPVQALAALELQLAAGGEPAPRATASRAAPGEAAGSRCPVAPKISLPQVDERQFATILAALRRRQCDLLPSGSPIDSGIEEIATDGGRLRPLGVREIDRLCEALNTESASACGLQIAPPPREQSDQPGSLRPRPGCAGDAE